MSMNMAIITLRCSSDNQEARVYLDALLDKEANANWRLSSHGGYFEAESSNIEYISENAELAEALFGRTARGFLQLKLVRQFVDYNGQVDFDWY